MTNSEKTEQYTETVKTVPYDFNVMNRYFLNLDFDGATNYLKNAPDDVSKYISLSLLKAKISLLEQEFDKALTQYNNMFSLFLAISKGDISIDKDKVINLVQVCSDTLIGYSLCCFHLKKYEEAFQSLLFCTKLTDNKIDLNLIACIYYNLYIQKTTQFLPITEKYAAFIPYYNYPFLSHEWNFLVREKFLSDTDLLDQVKEKYPDLSSHQIFQTISSFQQGKSEDYRKQFRQVFIQTSDEEWLNFLGQIWNYPNIGLPPDKEWKYLVYGLFLFLIKYHDDALIEFDKSTEIASNNVWFYIVRGFCYHFINQKEKALKDIQTANTFKSEDSFIDMFYAVFFFISGNLKQAGKYFVNILNEIISEEERSENVSGNKSSRFGILRGFVNYFADNKAQALQDFNTFLTFPSDDLIMRFAAYAIQKKYEEAQREVAEQIEKEPDNPLWFALRGGLYWDLNQFPDALADINKAIDLVSEKGLQHYFQDKINPHVFDASRYATAFLYWFRGQFYFQYSCFYEAISDFDLCINTVDKNNATLSGLINLIRLNKVSCYLQIKQYNIVLEECKKIIEIQPNNPEIYRTAGICYAKQKQYDNALDECKKVIEIHPDDAQIYLISYLCYIKMGDYDDALSQLKIMEEKMRYEPEILRLLYCIFYLATKDEEKSLAELRNFKKNIGNKPVVLPVTERNVFDILFNANILSNKKHTEIKFDQEDVFKECLEFFIESSISYMLQFFSILMDLDECFYINRNHIRLAELLDSHQLEKIDHAEEIKILAHQIFAGNYPDYRHSLSEVFQRDGKKIFSICSKLCFLEHLDEKLSFFKTINAATSKHEFTQRQAIDLDNIESKQSLFMSFYRLLNKLLQERYTELVEIKEQEKAKATIDHERKLAELKTNLFQAVSHTISNIMLANKGIIHKIKNKTSSATDIDRLELLNNLVLSTMKAIKLAFSKDSVAFSKTENDLFFQKTGNSISLYHFLYFCLNVNLYYLVTGEEGWETIREIFFAIDENDEYDLEEKLSALETMRKTPGFAISELSENNVNEFVSAFQSKVFQPVSRFFHIQADDLNDIYVKNNSYTFSILFIIFLELSKNMLRYGTVEDESVRKFAIRTESSPEGCRIIMSNICKKSRFSLRESTLQGLAMIQEFSKALGRFEKWEKDIPDTDFMEFTTVLFINRQN